MASWEQFVEGAPELAAIAAGRMDVTGLVRVRTLRANGWPRISPAEPRVVGHPLPGVMWQSRKALDLLRDPNCVVRAAVTDKAGPRGT